MVGEGADSLIIYVRSGRKHMKVLPEEWEGVPVKKQ